MKLKQTHKQLPQLTLTPVLAQCIEILQYSIQDLDRFLKQQAEENPFLDYTPPFQLTATPDLTTLGAATSETLQDVLTQQINLGNYPPKIAQLMRFLANEVDDNGYLYADPFELAERLGESVTQIETAWTLFKQLDPPGIGAQSVQECLLLQLERQKAPVATAIVNDYFTALTNHDWACIQSHLHLTPSELDDALLTIRSLQPRPGSAFHIAPLPVIVPDVIIEFEYNHPTYQLNTALSSMLTFDTRNFTSLKREREIDHTASAFLNQQQQHYRALTQMLTYREKHLKLLVEHILTEQHAFFQEPKPPHLRPLPQKDVANKMGVHPSTVSRLVREKTLSFQGKIYPLKTFLPKLAVASQPFTATMIKQQLQQLIAAEPSNHPLSDQALHLAFKKQGIALSRRAITNYRKQLNIPSSYLRKK
ncbi:MAG: RNA polymerase factor sigma-54 [Aerococcus sp.]|nr:RNA polymerase factor sigma-54 [Aerococcus sp.]